MNLAWLTKLDSKLSQQERATIVPTRSLATTLNERVARSHIEQGRTVWQAPNILVWSDYLTRLWQLNRDVLNHRLKAHTLLSQQQALVVWNQVIDASRREENALMLLNVQQTAHAVQRSWRLMKDWGISIDTIKADQVADTDQFSKWVDAYRDVLQRRGLIDESMLLEGLSHGATNYPFRQLTWVSYDLVTQAQRLHIDRAHEAGVTIDFVKPELGIEVKEYCTYDNTEQEILAVFERARVLLEQNADHTISVVIPDLQHRQSQVQELARTVFYPAKSPLDVQLNSNVYQFSLGQPLREWAAVEAALSVIKLLKNSCSATDLNFILRSRFLSLCDDHRDQCGQFERWLKRQRLHKILFENLPDLYRQFAASDGIDLNEGTIGFEFLAMLEQLVAQRQSTQDALSNAKLESGYATLRIATWRQILSDWLEAWGWRTNTNLGELNAVQYQLMARWHSLLDEFVDLTVVQRSVGLNRAIEMLQQMTHNTIFLPKAAASPIIICGILEAVGRQVDTCFLTGMHQDYPAPPSNDPFVAKRLLQQVGHPESTAESAFKQAGKVISSLMNCAETKIVSYARAGDYDQDVVQNCSPIFRGCNFEPSSCLKSNIHLPKITLETYTDTQGPKWSDPGRAKGGSRIFSDQSVCAFKAFATHQLGFDQHTEPEFGLDGLDRGNVLHHCLNLIWGDIQSQSQLRAMDEKARLNVINRVLEQLFVDETLALSGDKKRLLRHEWPRLQVILMAWLDVEERRPIPFVVVEREEQREGELGGIRFRYIVDRVDVTEDGRSVIIDYKTGEVNRREWLGERVKSPQMPLYALSLDGVKNKATSGIAFAKVKQGELKYVELAEADIFRKASTKKQQEETLLWQQSRDSWPAIFEQLAKDFLAGRAEVEPIDQGVCSYCELHSFCRVSQLREQS